MVLAIRIHIVHVPLVPWYRRHGLEELLAGIEHENTGFFSGNRLIEPPTQGRGKIEVQERLGGLLKFYRRGAA